MFPGRAEGKFTVDSGQFTVWFTVLEFTVLVGL
jgi:hypothetical protein